MIWGISMAKAYVLITTENGKEKEVLEKIEELSNLTEAHLVYGPYDLIAMLETNSMEKLKNTISWEIRQLPQIRSTISLLIADR
jgi:DNA-binding Lrp family transcriptional regulator